MRAILRLFSLRTRDKRGLLLLGPLFALVTCANVVTLSFSKAFFVANNDVAALPWMFLGASVFTMLLSILYLKLIATGTRTRRFHALLLAASVSFMAFGFVIGDNAAGLSLALFTWASGIGHIILIQTWSFSAVLLPTRQAKRLFPVFAASATLGASVGGALVTAITAWTGSTGLLFVAAFFLLAASVALGNATRRLEATKEATNPEDQPIESGSARIVAGSGFGGIVRFILNDSLLRAIAILVFGLQIASVLMDYQFTAALKMQFPDETELAGFFGLYYGLANLLTFGLALLTGSRLTRWFGIGLSASVAALVLLVGSSASAVLFFTENPALIWAIVITSFAERVMSFAVGKHAMQAAMSPIDQNTAERAKFVIEGVFYKAATLIVSVLFIFAPEILLQPGKISLAIVLTAAVALLAGLKLGSHYREHLRVGLRSRRVFAFDAATSWARREALVKVRPLLLADASDQVTQGLEYISELKVELPGWLLKNLLLRGQERVTVETLGTLAHTGQELPEELMATFLDLEQPVEVLLATLRLVPPRDATHVSALKILLAHEDGSVASLAAMRLGMGNARAASSQRLASYELRLLEQITDPDPNVHRDAYEKVGQLGQPEYIPPLLDLLEVQMFRRQAISTLAELPADAVVSAVKKRLEKRQLLGVAIQVWLIRVLEALSTPAALEEISRHLGSDSETVRGQAVHALWRVSRFPDRFALQDEVIPAAIHAEMDRLGQLTFFSAMLSSHESERMEFVRREVRVLQVKGERRVFRLLGIVSHRDAIERAYQHYRDPDKRTRSNAIELLDHTLGDGPHSDFVEYIEATEIHDGFKTTLRAGSRFQQKYIRLLVTAAQEYGDPALGLLADQSPWLKRLYLWARGDLDGQPTLSPFEENLLQRVLTLHKTEVFRQISGSELAILANVSRPVEFEPGETIFWQDEIGDAVYLITQGRAHVFFDGERIASMGEGACFGEMALVEKSTRSASVQASNDGYLRCLRISGIEFQDMLEIYPTISKGVINVLIERLRRALAAKDAKKEKRARFKATITQPITADQVPRS